MKLYEKIFLICMTIFGIVISLASFLKFQLFPYAYAIPLSMFIILFFNYSIKLTQNKYKIGLISFVSVMIIRYAFDNRTWQGLTLGTIQGLLILIVSITWITDSKKTIKESIAKRIKWISFLFFSFIASFVLFPGLSFLILGGLIFLIFKLFQEDIEEISNTDLQMVKISLVTSLFLLSSNLKTLVILSWL